MPYIKAKNKELYDKEIDQLVQKLYTKWRGVGDIEGDLNYIITSLFVGFLRHVKVRYTWINAFVGVLECCKQEFYRRIAGPYEDKKIAQNGDVYDE